MFPSKPRKSDEEQLRDYNTTDETSIQQEGVQQAWSIHSFLERFDLLLFKEVHQITHSVVITLLLSNLIHLIWKV